MSARIHFTAPGDGPAMDTVDGVHVEKAGADHTGGAYELFEIDLRPLPPMPPRRTPWAKTFYLLEGEMTVEAEGERFRLTPGAALTLPADVAHTFTAEAPGARLLGFATGDRAGRLFRAIVAALDEHPDREELVPTLLSVARANEVEFV
ncbi:cupin domain-containing protein [Nocardiopsis aegyptia]|uniref:Quercetin dioxygenase-like cupin family protein n=1 Tax=Nocardiopsis aegyptia TaxID=220378 RepID=A0A7Z0EN36_9ACTN|nr:cupin domain-containing protein [Nocardiopsis aegyptia]NYJ35165.1 quercetin dioxygenase-like cupin family protein [Nocardiopsis aegyptia]